MPQNFSDLGLSSDKILSVTRVSGDGSAGSLDTYNIKTRANPSGTGLNFTVQNGFNGAKGTDGIDGSGLQVVDFKDLSELTAWMDNDNNAKKIVAMVYRDTSVNPSIENSVLFSANLNSDQFHFFRVSWSQSGSTFSPSFLEIASLSNSKRVYAYYCETTEGAIAPRIAYLDTYTRNSGETDEQWLGRVLTNAQIFCDANSPLDNPIILASLEEYWQNSDASVLIVPSVSAGNRYQQFTFLFNGQWKKATTSDGTSWNITGSDAAFLPLGVAASVESALSAAYNYYSSHADARLVSPSCFALVGGKMAVIYPTEIGSGTATMNYSFGDISGYAETKDGGTTWALRKNLVMGDYDASTGVGYAEEANNLVATEGLDVLNAFSYDSVGGDASASINDGNATIKGLIGVDVAKNQWVAESMQTFTSSGITDTLGYFRLNAKIRHSSSSVQSVLSDARIDSAGAFNFIFKATFSGDNFYFYHRGNTNNIYFPVAYFDVLAGHTFLWHIEFTSVDTTVPNGVSYKNYALIDLTQRYGSSDVVDAIIGSDAANHVSRLFAFDPTILSDISQNAGVFVPSKSAKLKSVGKNLFPFEQPIVTGDGMQGGSVSKELWLKPNTRYTISLTSDSGNAQIYITLGDYGTEVPYSSSGSPLEVSFLTPSTGYVKIRFVFVNFGTSETYRNIMLNEGSAAIPYEPYEESIANLPDIELHGVLTAQNGKVVPLGDTANPLGGGKGRIGLHTFTGTESWQWSSSTLQWYCVVGNFGMKNLGKSICSNGYKLKIAEIAGGTNLAIRCNKTDNPSLTSSTHMDEIFTSNVSIRFELASETELESPSFQEFIPVKKGGTLEFLDLNNNTASLQGADIFYQKDIKGFIEGIGAREDIDWSANSLVSETQFNAGINSLTDEIKEGTIVAAKAELADNLATDKGASVDDALATFDPISQTVADGSYAKVTGFKGNSVAWNQLAGNVYYSQTVNGVTFTKVDDKTITISGTATARVSTMVLVDAIPVLPNHKYLIKGMESNNQNVGLIFNGFGSGGSYVTTYDGKDTGDGLIVENTNASVTSLHLEVVVDNGTALSKTYSIKPIVIDLTQAFPVNTPTELSDPRVKWAMNHALENPEFEEGKILDTLPTKIVSHGFNLWDEEWELGDYNGVNGSDYADSTRIRSKSANPIKVAPNRTYYRKTPQNLNVYFYDENLNYIGHLTNGKNDTFATPSNCHYIKFAVIPDYGTTYNNDICINFSNPSLNGTYKPWAAPIEYPLNVPTLRSAGSVRDEDKDAVATSVVGVVDLGTLNWELGVNYEWGRVYLATINGIKNITDSSKLNGVCSRYEIANSNDTNPNNSAYLNKIYKIQGSSDERIAICLESGLSGADVASRLNGVYLNYELATPTTEEASPLPENVKVFEGGSLEVLYGTDSAPALISMLYQVDIKGFVEGVGSREDVNWIPTNVASKQDVENGVKAVEDGEVVARLAKDLTPYSDESGSEQSKPFTAQGTATDNGTAEVTVGSFAQLKEKQGNTLAWNELVTNGDFSNGTTGWTAAGCSLSVSDNVATLTFSAGDYGRIYQDVQIISGHKYLMVVSAKSDTASGLMVSGAVGWHFLTISDKWTALAEITTAASTETTSLIFGLGSSVQGEIVQLRNIAFIDLTQLFPDNTPTSVSDPRVLWAIQYATSHPAYNAGSLIDGDGVKLACSGRNLWDEVATSGGLIGPDGEIVTGYNTIASTNKILVEQGKTYIIKISYRVSDYGLTIAYYDANGSFIKRETIYDDALTIPQGVSFIRFGTNSVYGSTYNHDITISLWYASGQDYDEYFPYEEPTITDTGSEILRSAGSVKDTKKPDGTITRRIGAVDLGTLDWTYESSYKFYSGSLIGRIKAYTSNIVCPSYGVSYGHSIGDLDNMEISVDSSGNLQLRNNSYTDAAAFKAAVSGLYLYFELAEYTTEQGTPFPEIVAVNDYGMMTWLKADGTYAEIPQGALFFYPADYKGLLDDIYYRCDPDGNASDLVVQSELSASETARDAVDAQLKEALGGTLRQLLAATKSIDFDDTAYVDLGSLNWEYNASGTRFESNGLAGLIKQSQTAEINNSLSTKYKVVSFSTLYLGEDKCIAFDEDLMRVRDTAYTDATAFKAAMKGVLLAYEKA